MDLNAIEIKDIQAYFSETRCTLPENMQLYLDQLELIRSMHQKYKSKHFITNHLVTSRKITRQLAHKLYCDALNYFYLDNTITKEAWRNIYAEKLDASADVAWHLNDMETYARNIVRAAEMRGLNQVDPPALPDDFYDRRVIIYDTDITKIGFKRESRAQLGEFIDALEITDSEKDAARQDAGILGLDLMEDA